MADRVTHDRCPSGQRPTGVHGTAMELAVLGSQAAAERAGQTTGRKLQNRVRPTVTPGLPSKSWPERSD